MILSYIQRVSSVIKYHTPIAIEALVVLEGRRLKAGLKKGEISPWPTGGLKANHQKFTPTRVKMRP